MRVSVFSALRLLGGGLLVALAACQAQPEGAASQAAGAPLVAGHFAGTLQVAGRPSLRAALELRHPRPGHYDAELVVSTEPGLSFVADTLDFEDDKLHVERPGQPGETLTLTRQGDFWRGTLAVDSVSYPLLLVRRGPPEPAVYRVRRADVPGSGSPALLFSPADETLPGTALALFPTPLTAAKAPGWADALARQGHAVLLLPAADTLTPTALTAALALLRRTPGVDTARVGAWVSGAPAHRLPQLLAAAAGARPAFLVVYNAPALTLAPAARRSWRALARRGALLAVYDQAQPPAAPAGMRALLGRPRVRQGAPAPLQAQVISWLAER